MKEEVLKTIETIRKEKEQQGKVFVFVLHVELYRRLNHSVHRYSHLDISRAILALQDDGILRTGHALNDVYYELLEKVDCTPINFYKEKRKIPQKEKSYEED